jgi:hypothetical protein
MSTIQTAQEISITPPENPWDSAHSWGLHLRLSGTFLFGNKTRDAHYKYMWVALDLHMTVRLSQVVENKAKRFWASALFSGVTVKALVMLGG